MDENGLGLSHHLLTGGDIHGTVDDATPHIEPNTPKVRERTPVTARVTIDIRVRDILEILRPDELRAVPNSTTVHAGLLHDCADASTARILLAVILSQHFLQHVVIAAVIVTYTVVLRQTRDKGTNTTTFIIIETTTVGILVEEHHGFRIFLTSLKKTRLALQLSDRVGIEVIDTATPTDSEKAAVLMRHLYKVGKELPTARLGL